MCKLILVTRVHLLATSMYKNVKRSLLHSFERTVHKVLPLPTTHVQQVSYIANNI
jgi:hypothetical protein